MPDTPDALMLFAAGFGTRMGAMTANLPKPLIKVAGKALIDHALAQVDGVDLARKVMNLHYLPQMIQAHLAFRSDLTFSLEVPEILETGGGLRRALPLLGPGPVYTLNTDAVWRGPNPLVCLREGWDPARMDALVLLIEAERAVGHGGKGSFDLDGQGRISRGSRFAYVGAQILRTEGLAGFPEPAFSLNRLWDRMIGEGRAFGMVYPGLWADVGHPQGIAEAEAMLRDV